MTKKKGKSGRKRTPRAPSPAEQEKTGNSRKGQRDSNGRFKKGKSGNPNGRRPGVLAPEKLRAAIAGDLPEILKSLIRKAKDGDMTAIKVVMDRVLPPLRAAEAPVDLGAFSGSLTEQGREILNNIRDGGLTPSQAAQLIGALSAQAKITEVDELARRVAALETKMEQQDGEH